MFDEAIVHLPESSEAVTLNSSALAILVSCDGATSVAEVAGLIADDLGADVTGLADDVLAAAQEMARLGILVPAVI
jgi:hypothetical protein